MVAICCVKSRWMEVKAGAGVAAGFCHELGFVGEVHRRVIDQLFQDALEFARPFGLGQVGQPN